MIYPLLLFLLSGITLNAQVVTWGSSDSGGDSSSLFYPEDSSHTSSLLSDGVITICSTDFAFAALKTDGSVVTWGRSNYGGNKNVYDPNLSNLSLGYVGYLLNNDVSKLHSTRGAFAALKTDGSVVTWGSGANSSSVASELSSGVTEIFSTNDAFVALKEDGSVVTWPNYVGVDNTNNFPVISNEISKVLSNGFALAILQNDGSVITWGDSGYGGDSSSVASELSSGVREIYLFGWNSFIAIKEDGAVISWGEPISNENEVILDLSSGVSSIYCTDSGTFAALKTDGSVITWGDSRFGGDSSSVASDLSSGVSSIYSTGGAYAALKEDGSVITWGGSDYGGDSSSVASELSFGVSTIYSNEYAFAALKEDSSVVTWGSSYFGGDSSSVASELSSGVSTIYSHNGAFAALKEDGSVVTWPLLVSDSTGILESLLSSGVNEIFSTSHAFAALTQDRSLPEINQFEEFYESHPDQPLLLDASPISGYPENFSYQWYVNDQQIPDFLGGTNNVFLIEGNSNYNGLWKVEVTNIAGTTTAEFTYNMFVDSDADGLSNYRETNIYYTNPNVLDTDGDGLNDYLEVVHGADPNLADTSGDGLTDGIIINAGFDPTIDYSNLVNVSRQGLTDLRPGSTIIEVSGNQATVQLQIEESSDLQTWEDTGTPATMTIPADTDTKFFRFKMAE